MNLKEALKLADKIVFEKTGQHLDDLQEAVLKGTLQRETYKEIAKNFNCSESNVRKIGSQLWEILSEELGENVNKSNLRSTMGRFTFSNASTFEKEALVISNFEKEVLAISSFNICGDTPHPPTTPNSNPSKQQTTNPQQTPTLNHDLTEMPNLGRFHNRTSELQTLKTSILTENAQLLTITGITGIGKTALITQLVQQIKNQFEYVIWRTLQPTPTLPQLQTNLTEIFSHQTLENPPQSLIKYLQKHRSLIILDDIHHIFESQQLVGQYKPEYEEYRTFFKQIQDLTHQSCIILIGCETPRETTQTNNKNTHHLTLTGLDTPAANQILIEQGLDPQHNWEPLINHYQNNPLWLKIIANFIIELELTGPQLTKNQPLLLPPDLKNILKQQLQRLCEIEKQILTLLASQNEPLSLTKLLDTAKMSSENLLSALQSLCRRSIIEKQQNLYTLGLVFKQYIRTI